MFSTACKRGTQARMSTEYLSHEQDADGVTTTLLDRLSGREFQVRSKYLIGADGGNSLVAEHIGAPIEGKMGVGGSMNILFRADLSKYVAHRPSVLYWVIQPGADVGGIGMGLVRMIRPRPPGPARVCHMFGCLIVILVRKSPRLIFAAAGSSPF